MRPQERPSIDQDNRGQSSRHLGTPTVKLASLATSPPSTSPLACSPSLRYPLGRDRPFQRDDPHGSNSAPSIRSASSFNRPATNYRISHHHARHHSNHSNFSTMSETSLPWTTRDIGFNAISGVLNDPAKRTQSGAKPGKSDVPSVEHAMIPRIKASDFKTYLDHIRPVFDRYRHNKPDEIETISPQHSPYGSMLEPASQENLAHNRRSSRNPYSLPNVMSSDSLALDIEDSRPLVGEMPMLENVPAIFFQPDFCLENPRTFDAVCEGADIIGNSGPNPPVSTNSILQEKLSYYLDTVEVHLIREIENRSSSFFEALSNLQALHQQTVDCVAQIHTIRQKMKEIQSTVCVDGLKVIQLQIRRRNLETLENTVLRVKEIRSAQPMIQILLGQGDYFGALDLMDETRAALQGKNQTDRDVDLKAVRALVNFSTQLDEMEKAVGFMMQHDFMSALMSNLHDADEQEIKAIELSLETLEDEKAKEYRVDLEKEKVLWDQLVPSTKGLLRTSMLASTLQAYHDQLLVEIKECVRKYHPVVSTNDSPESTSLAKHLKTMPFDAFFQMLVSLFARLLYSIQRATVYEQVITHLVDTFLVDYDPSDKQARTQAVKKELVESVHEAADLAHVRCGKMIGFRGDQNALLNPTDFYRLSSVLRHFIQQSERFCARSCFGLRGIVLTQQKAFIDHFHMERIKQEAQLIENEQWMASEVPPDFQRIVDRMCEGRIGSFALPDKTVNEAGEKTKFLVVHGESYFVVGCSLLIIKMFEDYLRCIVNLEGITTDIMQKLVELLKLFNSRICQVILGAGALRSAGLKNISAKHLALASQSVGLMIGLIPSLRDCIGRNMPAKHRVLLSEFDRIVRDYKDHQSEIHSKLVAIMNERFSVHVKAMQNIQWDEQEITGKVANQYMETLVKETMTLHKVLSKYLPHHDLQFIMSQVFTSFTTQLSDQISRLEIHTEQGKQRLAKDVTFFTQRLSSLQNIDPPSNVVIETVDGLALRTN
ncbi:Vps54-like protein-domain-containing protein [Phycomyces nitens]|nr:Vps54-like protein-domain-containing protein [Phycomyces nitens]